IGATRDEKTPAAELVLCDADSGHVVGRFRGASRGARGAALSSDGQRLFGVFDDGNVVVWDVETGEEMLVLRDAQHQLYGLALTPDGLLVAAGYENLLYYWDGRPIEAETAAP
ncbi:MAG TPA: hypothetical protein PK867_05955, partial [Pirellulales bacterium]|nr:hypothetical protein [Pirellulales bacterium]